MSINLVLSANANANGKVEALERCVLDLVQLFTTWKNSFARVNRLPPEILARVAWFLPSHSIYAGLRVCRYWYNVLMSPEVWSDIDLDRIDAAQVFLDRSKGAPVDVKIAQSPGETELSILSTYSSRIRSLDISPGATWKELLTHFSNAPAPVMRNLRVARDWRSGTYSQLPSTFFTGNLPSLKTLVLSGISSDLTHLVLPNLTTFELSRVVDSSATLSLSSLLDFLERSPLLEVLRFAYRSRYDDTAAPKRVVALHHLKSIHISGQPLTPLDTSRGLLAHLSLPFGVVAELSIFVHGSDNDIVPRAVPLHHDLIPCTKSLKKIRFQWLSDTNCVMTFLGDNGVLRIFANWRRDHQDFAAGAICSFGSLDVSGIDTLVVEGYGDNNQYFIQALTTLESLRWLTLTGCNNESLLSALRHEGTSPRLRHLTVGFTHKRGAHAADLLGMVKIRKLRGQGLETLSLDQGSLGNFVGDISSLQEHVGSLEV